LNLDAKDIIFVQGTKDYGLMSVGYFKWP